MVKKSMPAPPFFAAFLEITIGLATSLSFQQGEASVSETGCTQLIVNPEDALGVKHVIGERLTIEAIEFLRIPANGFQETLLRKEF